MNRSARSNKQPRILMPVFATVLAAALLSACSPAAPAAPSAAAAPTRSVMILAEPTQAPAATEAPRAEAPQAVSAEAVIQQAQAPAPVAQTRMVIRNADLTLIVADPSRAVDQVTQIAESNGGYVLNSSVAPSRHGPEARMTVRVDATQFAVSVNRIKSLAITVTAESASGQDVTAEFVDLQSRLRNLEIMEAQLLAFTKAATSTDDMLKSYNQAMDVRGQIEQAKGRSQFLSAMAAQSTINVLLSPLPLPEEVVKPVERVWAASTTVDAAGKAFTRQSQSMIDGLIWFGMVTLPGLLPWILFFGVLLIVGRRLLRALPVRIASPPAGPPQST
jgi:hypothetical protein